MCGPSAKTNFPIDHSRPVPPPQALSPSLVAKLEKCCVASREEAKRGTATAVKEEESYCMGDDDECIEEMIEELIYYGSIEITSSFTSSSSSPSSSLMASYGN